jgi:hypothetical protein
MGNHVDSIDVREGPAEISGLPPCIGVFFWKLEFGTVDMGAVYDCHQLPPITHTHRRFFSKPHENGFLTTKRSFPESMNGILRGLQGWISFFMRGRSI